MDNNRKTAYQTLLDVESKKAYSNIALNHKIAVNKPGSPAFVRELVYGVLERKLTLDHYIDQLLKEGIDSLRIQELTILRMGLYQLGYMDKVPEYAAISESVDLAKKYCKGRAGLINGVLREYQNKKIYLTLPTRDEDEVKYLSVKYSYAPWIIELWLKYYSVSFVEKLLEAGIIKKTLDGVKILGNGDLSKKLTVQAQKFTAGAKEKIEAAGGKAEVI